MPSGDIAYVEDVSEGDISEAEFEQALEALAASNGLKETPKPGNEQYEGLAEATLGELLDARWIKGEAEERSISVSEEQIAAELAQIKEQNFPTPEAYNEFLKTSKLTQEDVDKRVELQLLSTKVQEAVTEETPEPSESEISEYYEASKSTTFRHNPSRDVRIVASEDKADIEAAKREIEENPSPANWQKVASKYSEDAATQDSGGLQKGLIEDIVPEPLKGLIFGAYVGELLDPIKQSGRFTLIEVVKLHEGYIDSFDQAKPQVQETLAQRSKDEFFSEFVDSYKEKWTQRTLCAEAYEIERCANYKGDGHPAIAEDACYEEDPKKPAAECPAPVIQNVPMTPGSITVLKPEGEHLVQRPYPEPGGPIGEEGTPLPEEAP